MQNFINIQTSSNCSQMTSLKHSLKNSGIQSRNISPAKRINYQIENEILKAKLEEFENYIKYMGKCSGDLEEEK